MSCLQNRYNFLQYFCSLTARNSLVTAAVADHQKSTRILLAYSVDFWRSENCFGVLYDFNIRSKSDVELGTDRRRIT